MEVSCKQTSQMSAPTNNTTTYTIKTKYGDIEAIIGSEEENLTIILKYSDLADIIEKANKTSWKETNVKLYIEVEKIGHTEQAVVTDLPIPEEIQYLTPQQLREMQK